MVLTAPPDQPRAIIRLHCGNLRAQPMRLFVERHLSETLRLLHGSRLIGVYPDHLEASLPLTKDEELSRGRPWCGRGVEGLEGAWGAVN